MRGKTSLASDGKLVVQNGEARLTLTRIDSVDALS